jgi:hypothetical protein
MTDWSTSDHDEAGQYCIPAGKESNSAGYHIHIKKTGHITSAPTFICKILFVSCYYKHGDSAELLRLH